MAVNISTYMSLPIPIVGQEPGPTYAFDVNSCLTIVDQHNHVAGAGQQIPPSGLNINSDLTFLNNNAINLRSLRFQSQGSPIALVSDLGCLYESGVDLYYNDGNGNQIRITQSGSVTGAGGSITGLVSPASATYIPGSTVFVWQSDANTAANMDAGSYIFRNLTVSSFGLTLSPPTLSSNYTITLPALPASTKMLRIDNSGNISSTLDVDNTTIEINSNNLRIKPGSITTTQIASNANILGTQLDPSANILGTQLDPSADILGTQLDSAANILRSQIEASNLVFATMSPSVQSSNSGVGAVVTGLTLNITTEGKPVVIGLLPDQTGGNGFQSALYDNGASAGLHVFQAEVNISRTTGTPANYSFSVTEAVSQPGSILIIENPGVGTHTYVVSIAGGSGHNCVIQYCQMYAYEIC